MLKFAPKRDKVAQSRIDVSERVSLPSRKGTTVDLLSSLFRSDPSSSSSLSKDIVQRLEPIWDKAITPVLISAFGRGTTLNAIFYRGKMLDEIIMEFWDSKHVNSKASQIFGIQCVPEHEIKHLPRNKSQAKVVKIDHWS